MKTFSLIRRCLVHLKIPRRALIGVLITLFVVSGVVRAQQPQLSLVDIITVLRSKKATVTEKNRLLTEGVQKRGITFSFNPDLEKELRNAGANDQLVSAIRELSAARLDDRPQPKVEPTPSPKVEPTPSVLNSVVFRNRANENFVMGDFAAAIVDYDRAIDADATDSSAFFSRAMAHFNLRNFNLAVSDFNRFIELEKAGSAVYMKRGTALEQLGESEKALADYRKALELDASNESAKTAIQKLQETIAKTEAARQKVIIVQNKSAVSDDPAPDKKADPSVTNFGPLNRFAQRLVQPIYPQTERIRRTEGIVTVELMIDEDGKVSGVRATTGPKTLRQAAEDAVKKSRFNPVMVDNMAVKASGYISFNFKAN